MATEKSYALPTEPLLDDPTRPLHGARVGSDVAGILAELATERELPARSRVLYGMLRKQLGQPLLPGLCQGALALACAGRPEGIACLAALLGVQAPGQLIIERVRDFASTHRVATRLRARRDDSQLQPGDQSWLRRLAVSDEELKDWPGGEETDPLALPHPLDVGPARISRRVFGQLLARLEAVGTLELEELEVFIRLVRLELDAVERRASTLAGSINPYSARHVTQVMPILSAADTDLRDMRGFLSELEERGKASLFHRQHSVLREHLDEAEVRRLYHDLEGNAGLQIVRRLLGNVERNPLPARSLAYFCDRLLAVGRVLEGARLRSRPLDVVEAALVALEFTRDGVLELPAGERVAELLATEGIDGVDTASGTARIVLDPSAARRLHAPLGLPVPDQPAELAESEIPEEEQTVKDLVLDNLNNVSILLGLLKNAKVISTPGVVALVVQRCRNMRVLDVIVHTRALHAGFANKEVPAALLRTPMRIPVKSLRKFINVRYVGKVDLRRIARDRSQVRREVVEEIERYLKSLG